MKYLPDSRRSFLNKAFSFSMLAGKKCTDGEKVCKMVRNAVDVNRNYGHTVEKMEKGSIWDLLLKP